MVLPVSNTFSFAISISLVWICSEAVFPVSFFDQIAEIIGGQMHLICTVFYCRQARTLRFFGIEIVVQQIFEPGENVFVDIFAGDELTVVETDTIVEE